MAKGMRWETKKRTNEGWESVFFFFSQILLCHNNNDLTAPCGLVAASNVEAERERLGGGGGGGGRFMRLDSDQSCTLQRSTLMDLPPLLPALPYRSDTECAHTSMHSISLYLGLTLVMSHFCDYLSVVTAHSLKICRSSGSQFLQLF